MDKCFHCGRILKEGRRGLWKYYCNINCLKKAKENFKEAIKELIKGKYGCCVIINKEE